MMESFLLLNVQLQGSLLFLAALSREKIKRFFHGHFLHVFTAPTVFGNYNSPEKR